MDSEYAANIKIEFMKRIMFLSLLIAGLFISLSGFSAPAYHGHGGYNGRVGYGYHGGYAVHAGFGYRGGYGYAPPRFYPPIPVPIVYGPACQSYPVYYNRPIYAHPYYHRNCRRW
jgi:hypothetical protein